MPNVKLPEVTFKPWRYWSDWADVCAFQHGFEGHILQCRRARNGKLTFRVAGLKNTIGVAHATVADLPKDYAK